MHERDLQRRAIELLDLALDLEPEESAALLDAECEGHPELRTLVDSLLAADRADHALLDAHSPQLVEELAPAPDRLTRVGPYRLLAEVGRGGMATVYLAEREVGGARQRVALKLLKRGVDTDEVLRRFGQEVRVLASLDHPGIARFYDAQASEEGTPYLAMEFVHGRPLSEHCDEASLGITERLRLFRDVCSAVEFAHQRLVVHRDLKPSNILVTDVGDVKLLDFGIAKLLSDEIDPASPLTRTGIRVLTPEYAAPEQLQGGTITTATDVYALGVILYLLLTGSRPQADGTPELQKPSTLLRHTTRDATASPVAHARSTTPDRLKRALRGDLDTIVMKALAAEPSQRYQSATDLADDVDRFLEGRPIEARPATLGYRMDKFVRRHTAGVVATATAAVFVVGFSIVYTRGIARERDLAEDEASKAQTTTEFLQRLLGEAYPSVSLGDALSMTDLLGRAVARVDSIENQPEIQAELLRTLGDVYREQGRFDEALPLLERAVAIHRTNGDITSRAGGQALDALGHLYYQRDEYDRATAVQREALEIYEAFQEPDDSLVLFALSNLAADAGALDDFDEALRLHGLVLSRSARLFADTSELVHVTHNNLGNLYHRMGEYEQAVRELTTAVAIRRRALPPNHPSLGLSLNNLGASLRELGRLEEAEQAYLESLEIFRLVFEPGHPRIGLAAFNLALLQRSQGRYEQAEENFRLTLAIDRQAYGTQHLEVGADLRMLGFSLEESGDCPGAVEALTEAEEIFAANELPLTHRRRLTARARLGTCLGRLGRSAEAEEVLRASLAAVRADPVAADSAGTRDTAERLEAIYRASGRSAAADSVRLLAAIPRA